MSVSGIVALLFFAFIIIVIPITTHMAEAKRKKMYSVITAGNKRSIDEIASICDLDYSKAAKRLQKMINDADNHLGSKFKMLKGAYIDSTRKSIVLAADSGHVEPSKFKNPFKQNTVPVPVKQKRVVVITCGGCGAENTIDEGTVAKCEYCGVPLSSNEKGQGH